MLILRFQSSEAFYCCVVKKHDTYRCMNLEMSSFVHSSLEGLLQIGDSPPQFWGKKFLTLQNLWNVQHYSDLKVLSPYNYMESVRILGLEDLSWKRV